MAQSGAPAVSSLRSAGLVMTVGDDVAEQGLQPTADQVTAWPVNTYGHPSSARDINLFRMTRLSAAKSTVANLMRCH